MSRRNRMIVRKLRNIVILLMAIIVMIGAYKNIKDSRAEDVIEIDAIAIDNYGYLSNELFKLEATQIGDELYEIELPESVNGKEINQIITVTLEEPIPEVETESGVQENASTENTVESEQDVDTTTNEQKPEEETTSQEDTTETPVETPDADEPTEDVPSSTEEDTPQVDTPQVDTPQVDTPQVDVPEVDVPEEIPSTEEEIPDSTQNPIEQTVENALEIIENKIILTKEQLETKQLNIEVTYNVAILETNEQGEFVKNLLSEKTEEERKEIEITEETQVLYSKILKYEDEENQKLVEVRGFLPIEAELQAEEVSQEKLVEIFDQAEIDIAYDIKIVKYIRKEILIDEQDLSKGTEEIIETIEINPEDFGEKCQVLIKDVNIQTESTVLHVKDDNRYEQIDVKENTEENITFDADTFSIYAVTTDEQLMLSATSDTLYYYADKPDGDHGNWSETKFVMVVVSTGTDDIPLTNAEVKFSWRTTATAGGTNAAEGHDGSEIGEYGAKWFSYTSDIAREGIYYLGYTVIASNSNGETLNVNDYAGPFHIDYVNPGATTYTAHYADGTAYNGEWTNKQVYTTLKSTDGGSGVSYFQYQKSGASSWTQATSGGSSTTQSGTTYTYDEPWTLKDRNDTYTFRAVDGLGHVSSASSAFTVKYDLTAPTTPTITATKADGTTYTSGSWTNQNVVLTPSATDAGSGVSKYQYSTNGSTWSDMSNGTVTFSSEMNGTVYVRAVDALGYVSESSSIVIRIDKTSPSYTSAEIKNVSGTGYDVYVYGVSDSRSGINRVQFPTWTDLNYQDDINFSGESWQTASAASGTNMGNGTWYYRVNTSDHNNEDGWYNTHIYLYDNAGNSFTDQTLIVGDDEDHGKVYIDRTPPQITIDTDNGIVRRGLIRHYDAVNNTGNGYDSSATTWKDLSGHYDADVPYYQEAWDGSEFLYLDTAMSLGDLGTLTEGYTIEAEMLLEELMSFYTQGDWKGFGLFGTASGWNLSSNGEILFPCGVSGVNPQVYGTADLGEVLTCSITWDEANHIYTVYINGDIVYTVNVQHECDGSNTEGSWGEFEIGPYSNHLNLKSIKIYNTPLSQEEIYQNLLASGASVSDSGLVRHYDAVNNTGSGHSNTTTTWKDLSGNYDATVNGATFTNSNLSFDGVDDWVNAGQVSFTDAATVQATVQLNSIQTEYTYIIGNWENGGCGLYLYDGGKPYMEVYISGTGYIRAAWNQVLQVGVKYDITGTYDGKSIKLYINGELKAETAVAGTIGAPNENTVMAIGANPKGSTTQGILTNAKIYNAKVYTRALTGYEVYKSAYDAGVAEELEPENVGLIRNFNALNNTGSGHSNSATTWKDLSGNSDGTVGGATFYDNYLSFDGTNDYVQSGSLDLSSNRLTVDTTIELKSIQSGEADIICYTEAGGFSLDVHDGKPYFDVYITDVGYQWVILDEALEINTKYRITATYDGSSIKLYINGELKAETAASGTIKAPDGTPRLVLGAEMGASGDIAGLYANINMYEAKIYNRALKASEISPDEAKTWKKEHTVTVTLSDDYSGLASGANIQYGWSTSTTTPPSSYTTATLSYTAGARETTFEAVGSGLTGKYYLWVVPETLQDLYGNSQNATAISSDTYWFDNTAPTITFDPQQNETWAKTQSVTVNIGDAHSGLATGAQVQYQWVAEGGTPSSSGWTTKTISGYTEGTNSVTFTVTNSTLTGKYKLYIKVQTLKDISEIGGNELVAGEIMTSDGYFWLDNAKPTLNVTSTGNDTWSKSHTATVTIADAHSGLAEGISVQYGWGNEYGIAPSSWNAATITSYSAGATSTTFIATGSGLTGKYYLWVKPTTLGDKVGNNITAATKISNKLFYFDNTKPMVQVGPTAEIDGLTASEITADDYGGIVTNYSPSNGSTGNWQIFHTDGENIYLISQDYVQNTYVPAGSGGNVITKHGAYGVRFNAVLNDYPAGTATIAESNPARKWLSKYLAAYPVVKYANMRATAYMIDTTVWSGFEDGNYAEYAIGGPTIELFTESYNTVSPDKTIETQVSSQNGYHVKWSTDSSWNSWIGGLDTDLDESKGRTYVGSTSADGLTYATWLASPSAYNYQNVMAAVSPVEYGDESSGIVYQVCTTGTGCGIRPVIALKSDVQLEKQEDGSYQIVENTSSTGANIVQDGLIRHYDVSNNTGSGHINTEAETEAIWKDLSGNYDATITADSGDWFDESGLNMLGSFSLGDVGELSEFTYEARMYIHDYYDSQTLSLTSSSGDEIYVGRYYASDVGESWDTCIWLACDHEEYDGDLTISEMCSFEEFKTLTVTYSNSQDTCNVYVDGVLISSENNITDCPGILNGELSLGVSGEAVVSDIRLYNRALSQEEIIQNVNAESDSEANDTWSKTKDVEVKIYDKHSGLAANAQFKYGWSTSLTTEPTKWNTVTVSDYSAGTGSATFTATASPETIGETEPADKYYLWVEPVDFKDISVEGGNSQTEGGKSSELYWIDAKKPTVEFNPEKNETWARSHTAEVIINDAHSGLAQLETGTLIEYQWVLEGETPSDDGWEILAETLNYTEGTNEDVTFSITKAGLTGKYQLCIKTPPFKDLSEVGGNETDSVVSSTGTYWFDNEAPIVNLGSQGNAEWEQSYSIPVTVTDEHSGMKTGTEIQYGWSTSTITEPTQWHYAQVNEGIIEDGLIRHYNARNNTGTGYDSTASTWKDLTGNYDITLPEATINWGDIDEDGVITEDEAYYLLDYTLYGEEMYPLTEQGKANADVNLDGMITDQDAIYILRAAQGNTNYLPQNGVFGYDYIFLKDGNSLNFGDLGELITTGFTLETKVNITDGSMFDLLWEELEDSRFWGMCIRYDHTSFVEFYLPCGMDGHGSIDDMCRIELDVLSTISTTWDPETHTIKAYLNGEVLFEGTFDHECSGFNAEEFFGNLLLDVYGNTKINDIKVYDRPLTQAEVQQNVEVANSVYFNAETPSTLEPGKYYLWVKPETVVDVLGNSYGGSTTSTTWVDLSGHYDAALPDEYAVFEDGYLLLNGGEEYPLNLGELGVLSDGFTIQTENYYDDYIQDFVVRNTGSDVFFNFNRYGDVTIEGYLDGRFEKSICGYNEEISEDIGGYGLGEALTIVWDVSEHRVTVYIGDIEVYTGGGSESCDGSCSGYNGELGELLYQSWDDEAEARLTNIKVYDRPLTQAEVQQNVAATSSSGIVTDGLIRYYDATQPTREEIISQGTFWLDNQKPEVTIDPQEREVWAKTHSVTVNVQDTPSGLAEGIELQYQWVKLDEDTGDLIEQGWQTVTIPEYTAGDTTLDTITITTSDLRGKYYFWLKPVALSDMAGNEETEIVKSTGTFWFDYIPPQITITPEENTTWQQTHTAEVGIFDEHCGLELGAIVKYGWSTSNTTEPTTWTEIDLAEEGTPADYERETNDVITFTAEMDTQLETGEYYLWVVPVSLQDIVGNIAETKISTGTFNVDYTAPTITLETEGNAIYKKVHTVDVILQDEHSGIASGNKIKYGWSTSTETAPSSYTTVDVESLDGYAEGTNNPLSFTATTEGLVSTTGSYYLWVVPYESGAGIKLLDKAGNSQTTITKSTGTFFIDYDAPIWTTENINIDTTNKEVTVDIVGKDALSGYASNSLDINDITVKVDGEIASSITKNLELVTETALNTTLYGDVNCDGVITEDDTKKILLHVTMPDQFPLTEDAIANADVNLDGVIDSNDVTKLQLYIEGTDTLPPVDGMVKYTLTLSGFEQDKLLQAGKNYKEWSGAVSINIAANTLTDNAGNTNATDDYALGQADFVKPQIIYRYSESDIDKTGKSVKIKFDVTDKYYQSGTLALSDLTIYIDGEDVTNNAEVKKEFATPTAVTAIVNGSSKTIGYTYTLTLSELEETEKDSGENYLDYSGIVTIDVPANKITDTSNNKNDLKTITMGINLPEETGSGVIADVVNPIWETQNITIDKTNKKVTVDLIGTDKYYVSNSLDASDITVYVDGTAITSTTNVKKSLSTATELKEDRDVDGTAETVYGVKYTLTLTDWEESTLQDGKIFKEWSGTTQILIPAGTLTDGSSNTNIDKSFTLGLVDFTKPVIEPISVTNGTTTQTIVFNVIDKYLNLADAVATDEIIVSVDGVEVSDITKTIKSKTNLTATVNGSSKTVGQQYTLELEGFTQDDWTGTVSVVVKAAAVYDTSTNPNDLTTLYGKHIDEAKPTIEKVSSSKDSSAGTETIIVNVMDRYLDTTDALTGSEINVYVDNVEVTDDITKTVTKIQDFTATVNGDSTHVIGQQYQVVLSGFEQSRAIAYNQYTEYSGTVKIEVVAGAVKDIVKDESGGNTNDLTPIDGDFVDFIRPDVNYIYSTSDINYTDKNFTMVFEIVDKYFAGIKNTNNELETEMTNAQLAEYLTTNLAEYFVIEIDGEDITTNANVTKEITEVTDVIKSGTINKTVDGTVQSVTNAVIGKSYTLKLSQLQQDRNDGLNYSGVVSVAIKTDTATDESGNGNLVETTTIKTGDLPSGGTPEDGTVDVVDPVWVQAADPTVKPSEQTATITVKATDKFYDSDSFDETDITVLVNGAVTTEGITVQVVEDTSVTVENGAQYKVTVTGFPETAYSLKIVINEGAITDMSGNISEEQEFVLYTTLMATDTETKATSAFLGNTYGIERQYVEQVIFMETVEGTEATRWDVSAVQDKSIMAWYETRTSGEKTLYTVYIGSKVIMNANRNSSYLFNYVGYDSSCKVTGNTADNPLIKNLELLRMDNVVDMSYMFRNTGYRNMKSLDLGSNFNTENVTNMKWMFRECGYNAMATLDLGDKFDTSKVTDMSNMFYQCGVVKLETLDLGDNFDTSLVTDMEFMFVRCGKQNMTSLDLGDKFDTSNVTDMYAMFKETGYAKMTNLDLGDKFDTSNVTDMMAMFQMCGYTEMTSLDLGPKFTKIPSINDRFMTETGKTGECVIYAPSSIYKDMTTFRLNKNSTTTISLDTGRGTINPIYKPEWEKVSSTLTADGTMTIVVKGSAIEEFNIGNTLTDPQNYLSDVTSESNALTVYVDGEAASDVTASIVMGTPTLNETTGAKEITATITLSNFAKTLRKTGKNFLEWSGNVSVQLAQGTLVDVYGNPNLAEIGIDTSGGTDRVEIEDALTDRETDGIMFVDDIKPEFTYEYSETTTSIDHGTETVTVVFDVTDKYFSGVDTSKFKAENIGIIVDSTQIPSTVVLGKTLTKLQDLTYTTGDGTVLTIGAKYQLEITGLDQGNGSTYSGPMTLSFPAECITDKSGNTSDAKSITLGVNEPGGDPDDEIIVDVVDPIWKAENINIDYTNKKVTVDLVAYDKYFGTGTTQLDADDITIYIDGEPVTTTTNVKKSLSTATAVTNGMKYTLTLSDWPETTKQGTKNFFEWSGTTKIKIAAGTITDQYGNTSEESEWFELGHVDFVKPEIVEVDPTTEIQTQDATNKTETIVFNVWDKYLNTVNEIDSSAITVYVDGVAVSNSEITRTLTKVQDFTATVNGDPNHVVGQQYKLVISGLKQPRTIAYNQYTEYSGTVSIEIAEGAVNDSLKTTTAEITADTTKNVNEETPLTGDFVDYIEPDVNYIYSTSNINYNQKYFTMDFEIVDKYFANSSLTNETIANYLVIYVDGEDITRNANVTKEITEVTDVTKSGTINKTVDGTVQSVTNPVIGKRYTLKLSNLEQVENDGLNYSGVVSVAIKSGTATDESGNGNLVETTTIKTGDLPSGGTPEDGTVDVVDPVWVQAEDPFVKPSLQTATITVKAQDKFYDSDSFDETDITVLVNGVETTDGITVQVVEDTSVSAENGTQYKVTVTGFPETAYSLKIVINEGAITDKSGNLSEEQQFVLYTTLMETADETEATSLFLDNPYGIQRQYVEQVIFMETVEGTAATRWDVSAAQDNTITAWYETRTASEKTLYTVYIGSKVIMNANLDSSYLFRYIGYDSSCKVTGDTADNPLIKNLELLRMDNVTDMSSMFAYTGYSNMKSLDLGSNFNTENVTDMRQMFVSCGYTKMESLDLGDKFDTSNVRYMTHMFNACGYKAMTGLDLSSGTTATNTTQFNTSSVEIMEGMFINCGYMKMGNLNLGNNFDTTSVTRMDYMFKDCGYTAMTSLDLSSGTAATNTTQFNTSSVTDMTSMFDNCGREAMITLNLGNNFDTSSVTNMESMFRQCGHKAMTSLDLGDKFDTSNVTTMRNMFNQCGYTAMVSLDLGNSFDTSSVTNMRSMFNRCGYKAMTSLDLGDLFNTTNVEDMYYMLHYCGTTAMTTLDLGPAFVQIPNGLITETDSEGNTTQYNARSYAFRNVGALGCVIYVPSSIYSGMAQFRLNKASTITIDYDSFDEDLQYSTGARGTINPIYKPEWEKVSSTLAANGTMTVVVKGSAIEEFNIGNALTDPQNYLSDVTSESNALAVYVDGEIASDVTASIVMGTPTLNETTGAKEIQATITISNFAKTLRQTGKNFLEWSGNVSVQLAQGTLVDIYGNPNLAEIGIDTSGGMERVEIKDTIKDRETDGIMFVDDIKPEFTYEYSTTSTVINHGQEAADEWVKVVFDVTDKYFNSVDTSKFKTENIDIIVDSTQIPSTVTLGKTLTKVKDIYYDSTAGVNYVDPGETGTGTKVGEQYQLQVTGLDQGDGFTYSGPMTISFPAGCITDKTGNTSDAKSITLGVNEPDQTGSAIIVDVVDPVWSVEGTPQVTHSGGVTTATMTLIATDKYYNGNTIISAENQNLVRVIVDGIDISVDANNDGISDIAPGLVKTLEKLEDIKETRNGTQVTIGEKYKLTVTGLEETDEVFFNNRELYESSNGTSGRIYREYVGNVSIVIPENTIIDQHGNGSNEYPVSLGYIDVLQPEVIKVSSRNIVDATNVENSKQEIVFDIVDKYLSTSAISTTDTSKIHVLVDGTEVTDITKTITNITEFKAMVNGTERTVGYRYTLELSEFQAARTATYGTYTNWSGDISILIDEGTAADTSNSENDETELEVGYADFIKPDVTYIYATDDIDKTDKEFTMVFEITDKYFNTSTLDADDLTILVDGESTIIDTNGDGTPDTDRITRSLTSTDITYGKRYTLTLRNLEQLQIQDGDKYLDFSGVITVAIPQGVATDTNTPTANGNDQTTITSGINIPGGTGTGTIVDVVDPLIERVSSSANAINQTGTITIRGTDKYLNDSTLTTSDIKVWVNGTESSIVPTLSTATPLNETRLVNGTNTTKQYGVEYTITVSGFATNVNQVKIQIAKDALKDESGNGNKVTDLMLYNCLELTNSEDLKTDGFLDGNGTNSTGIARQDIEQVIFTSSIDGATASGVAKVWDVSAQNDGSIKAWTSQTSAPYTVYIGSDFEIFANQDSSSLFRCIGKGTSCTATETLKGLNLLNTCSVINMTYMFAGCGYNAMTGLDLSAGTTATNTTQFNTSNVTNMYGMFVDCGYNAMVTLNLGNNFDTSKVTDMSGMFNRCGRTAMTALSLGSKFNTGNVTEMSYMFAWCGYTAMTSLNLGTKFDTSKVTDMSYMFRECGYTAMTSLDLSSGTVATNTTQFNTSNVTNMYYMFGGCGYTAMTSLNLGNNFDTSQVVTTRSMFDRCGYKLMGSLDLGNKFDTSNVKIMWNMFGDCGVESMTSLKLGDKFDTSQVTNMGWMFANCGKNKMTSLDLGDKFDTSNVTNMYKMFSGCGTLEMTCLDLGPQFIKIPTGTIEFESATYNANQDMFRNCGTSSLKIYAPESIYLDRTSFK